VRKRFLLALAALAFAVTAVANAQTITKLKTQAPDGVIVSMLLTDGRVLAQGYGSSDWWTLTPDITGSYVNGTWQQVASLPSGYSPLYMAEAVMIDGRVVIEGGEYNFDSFAFTNMGAGYDPIANTWTMISPPAGWGFIGDSPSAVLPNGQFLVGEKMTMNVAELDPHTWTWTELASTGKADWNAEEGWTLLPNGTVLTADVKNSPNSEHYDATIQTWIQDGSTVANLMGPCDVDCANGIRGAWGIYYPPGEIGPAILRPDGTVFATGALHLGANTGHTAIYTPGAGPDVPGTWVAGPDFPNGDDAGDNFAALLTSGNVLVAGNSASLYEFNGTTMTRTATASGSLLVLPTAEILIGGEEVYRSTGTYQQFWAPMLFPLSIAGVKRGSTYTAYGSNFNGMSQANAYGDENNTATNYPLVRLTNMATGHVFYARTHDHSSMAVRKLGSITSTHFDVPAAAETGTTTMVVVTNGIPSNPITVMVF
jgi:hypothetical protein